MIEFHGKTVVDKIVNGGEEEKLRTELETAPVISLDWSQYQNTINIATGRFSPLEGFLSEDDFSKVAHEMRLQDGTVWPLPITLDVDATTAQTLTPGKKAGLCSPGGDIVGAIDVTDIYEPDEEEVTKSIYGSEDESHPGVGNFLKKDDYYVGGPIYLFGEHRLHEQDLLPVESRELFDEMEWDTVAGFQTRNAPHRAHEYIQRSVLKRVDGLLVQPKIGEKKVDDYRDEVIMGAYDVLVDNYYRSNRIVLSIFPCKMSYAGPREAIFDALVRKNQGCTHFVVGRDHAGVEDYYGELEAQRAFEDIEDIGIEIIPYDHSFYCDQCDRMTSKGVCPHDEDQRIYPSGTKIRNEIRDDRQPSEKIMRPEVANYILENESPFVTATGRGGRDS